MKRIIEVGVFTGYSSIALALSLPPAGRLLACDRDPRAMALARQYWAAAGVADKVEERLGPARETLEGLLADPAQRGAYDFAFIDADKKVGGQGRGGRELSCVVLVCCQARLFCSGCRAAMPPLKPRMSNVCNTARPSCAPHMLPPLQGYRGYYEQLLQLVRPGGVIVLDNVLW